MKIKKINFNPKLIKSNPTQAYDNYAQNVIKALRENSVVDRPSFYYGLHTIGEAFVAQNAKEQMNKKSKWLAETLVSLKQENLAGVIYSFLVKLNYDKPNLRELFATNALAIATRLKDNIHIMARANDLKEIYKVTARGSDKHIKVLYQEKRALNDIINNYENLKSKQQIFRRAIGSKEGYQQKLGAIKFEIGELLLRRDPVLAKKELEEAKEIFSNFGDGKYSQKIEMLLQKLS